MSVGGEGLAELKRTLLRLREDGAIHDGLADLGRAEGFGDLFAGLQKRPYELL